jgi:hypothetical protein
MKSLFATLVFLALLSLGTACQACLIDTATVVSSGDGLVGCLGTWDRDSQTMTITGQQAGVGRVGALPLDGATAFNVPSGSEEEDPTITLRSTINNDTGFSWGGYRVNIYMNKSFTISDATVYYGGTSGTGWSGIASVTPAQLVDGEYVGQVDFFGGNPILAGGTLDISYQLTFVGSVRFSQEMIPMPVTAVPEPGAIALAITGLVGLLVVRRKFAR